MSRAEANRSVDPTSSRRRRLDLGYALLGLVVLGLLFRPLARGQTALGVDVGLFSFPRFQLLGGLWRGGDLPGWNPYMGGGSPLFGDPTLGVLYPANVLLLLTDSLTALNLYLLLHMLAALAGTYLLARRLRLARSPSALAALTFVLSGPLLSLLGVPIYIGANGWLPWAALAFLRALEQPSPRRVATATIPFAAMFLLGAPENCVTSAVVVVALAWASRERVEFARPAILLAGTATLALALCAVVLIPALLVVAESTRASGIDSTAAGAWSLHPSQLLELFVPQALKTMGWPTPRRPWYESLHAGLIPLALIALGSLAARRERRARVLLGAALLFLLLALGSHTFIYQAAYTLFPPARLVRYPAKLFVAGWFLFSLLAGVGLQRLPIRERGGPLWIVLSAGLALVLALVLYEHDLLNRATGPLIAGMAGLVILACVPARRLRRTLLLAAAAELTAAGMLQVTFVPRELFTTPILAEPAVQLEQTLGRPARLTTLSDTWETGLDLSRYKLPSMAVEQFSWRQSLCPNAGMSTGVRTLRSFSSVILNRPVQLREEGVRRGLSELELSRMQGVELVVYAEGDPAAEGLEPFASAGPYQLARLAGSAPWAALYVGAQPAGSLEEALALRLGGEVPRDIPVVESASNLSDTAGRVGEVVLERMQADLLVLKVEAPAAAVLVLRETWSTGWEAEVDGQPAAVFPADVAFRGVHVPAGSRRITLRYRVPGYGLGLALTLVTLVFLLVLLAYSSTARGASPA